MSSENFVRDHYSGASLEATIVDALAAAGVGPDAIDVATLAPVDNFHAGFLPATEHVVAALHVDAGSRLLDVGCGIGGPARVAAATTGCSVVGVDLSPDFVEAARGLSARLGLADRVEFHETTATGLPFGDDAFDAAMMIHVGMNIEDKASVFGEVARVLRSGSHFVVYDQMRKGPGELAYPLPWATDPRSSFVSTPDEYVSALEEAGFTIVGVDDRTTEVAGPPTGPASSLNPGVLLGPWFGEAIGNNIGATLSGVLGAILIDATAP